ncbi:MAG TPA: glycerophosphodiester phosphodiesterase family protein, partial [Chitinophagaceae bacterium]|nr:glycerophosphodiester phosphodiesterase family protein [Chitinophagaceae bacterium]
IKTSVLVEASDKRTCNELISELGFIPAVYSPAYQLVNAELIKEFHANKIKVIPWTVNDKSTMEKLKKMGVDGLISDYPNLFNE